MNQLKLLTKNYLTLLSIDNLWLYLQNNYLCGYKMVKKIPLKSGI